MNDSKKLPSSEILLKSSNQLIFESDINEEDEISTFDRFSKKFKDQPLVPIGAGATTIALLGAGRAIQQGQSQQFNLWCRYRVIFQGLTILAALGGSLYYNKERQDTNKLAIEEDRIRQRDLRIRQQEEQAIKKKSALNQLELDQPSKNSLLNEDPQSRKTLLKRKMIDQARLDGNASRASSD
ncbi:hypothetical protein O181_093830 [Austropuccinia psidii MF-1]|uniref:HIG1 domain-containing protein n=1 Tax=Austropuccinia psidii MF-1 TaxID=1389203 RepID=A0A9Q3J0Z2_9BASI|nr:hypothetical protein [Austropuccinia psidii MF-1]